jgi:hypothetical protein
VIIGFGRETTEILLEVNTTLTGEEANAGVWLALSWSCIDKVAFSVGTAAMTDGATDNTNFLPTGPTVVIVAEPLLYPTAEAVIWVEPAT